MISEAFLQIKTANKIAILVTASVLFVQSVTPAFAADRLTGQALIRDVNQMQNQASRAAQVQQNQLQAIIKRSDTLITNRINSLNTISTRIQNDNNLSSAEKNNLAADIQTEISGLTSLKNKIDADTDVTTARNDEKEIITNYYVYEKFEPKIRLLIVLNNLQTVNVNLQALIPQLQNLVDTFKSQGKDVSSLQVLLNDVSSQLQTINSTLNTDTSIVESVSATTQNSSTTFSKVHQDIAQIVRSGFTKIRSDFAQMRPLFHQLILPGLAPSQATPSSASATTH